MSKVEDFLSSIDEKEIVEAIRKAELKTSGEIRVHIEASTEKDPFQHAVEVFHYLKMDNTKESNGVIIYIAVESKVFVIYGDKGINEVVPENFWSSTKDIMQEHFKKGEFKEGIIAGVTKAGEQLQKFFPWQHGDVNELPDSISKGDDDE